MQPHRAQFRDTTDVHGQHDRPCFELGNTEREPASAANLDRSLTINSTTVAPTGWWNASDVSGTTLVAEAGDDLEEFGSGSSPAAAGSPLMGADASLLYGGKGHQAASAAFADWGSGWDRIVELVLQFDDTVNARVLDKRGAAGQGIMIHSNGSALVCHLSDGSNTADITSGALVAGAWYHMLLVIDGNGNGRWFACGKASGSATSVASVVDCDDAAEKFSVGSRSDTETNVWTRRIGMVALWLAAGGWLDTDDQATLAAARHLALAGLRPQVSAEGGAPLVRQRNSVAMLEKYDAASGTIAVFKVGEHWLRSSRELDSADRVFVGLDIEPEAEQKCSYSQIFGGWTPIGSPTVLANDASAPDGETTADKITVSSANKIYRSESGAVADAAVAVALWVKRVSTSGTLRLQHVTATANGQWDVDLSALPDRWVRLTASSSYVSVVNAWEVHNPSLEMGIVIQGTAGDISVHAWQAQLEEGYLEATSDIEAPNTADVTRLADELRWDGLANVGGVGSALQGAIVVDILSRQLVQGRMLTITDGGSTAERINLYTVSGLYYAITATGGASQNSNSAVRVDDGTTHRLGLTWTEGVQELWVDGVLKISEVPNGIPDELDRIDVGQSWAGTQQIGMLRGLKIFRRFRHDMADLTRLA
jgi:hypothetical protein